MSRSDADRIHPGNIVLFKFPYSEGFAPCARPSLVVDATDDELLLAYCKTFRKRANVGFEIRLHADYAACGLDRASRFVLVRRIRVARSDPRLEISVTGSHVLGRFTDALLDRKRALMSQIAESWKSDAERRGLHPAHGHRRRRTAIPAGSDRRFGT